MLKVENLNVNININGQAYPVLDDVSFTLNKGDALGLVGESGCGKSLTALAIMGMLRNNIRIESGSIMFNGIDLAKCTEKEYGDLRGKRISMIFQDSMSSLNPLMKVGKQIKEAYGLHYDLNSDELEVKTIEALKNVGFDNPKESMNKYPHQMSGGQRQRIMTAIAISAKPELLIADEPTTALDVITENKILSMLKRIQEENQISIIIISHDITVVSRTCSHVAVMYSGHIVEYGKTGEVIKNPKHPYTRALINSIPDATAKDNPLNIIRGQVPSLTERPAAGCAFAERCNYRTDECKGEVGRYKTDTGSIVSCCIYKDCERYEQ